MIDRDLERLIEVLVRWFESENWTIEAEEHRVVAVMSSGYGSGPAVVNITALAQTLHEAGRTP